MEKGCTHNLRCAVQSVRKWSRPSACHQSAFERTEKSPRPFLSIIFRGSIVILIARPYLLRVLRFGVVSASLASAAGRFATFGRFAVVSRPLFVRRLRRLPFARLRRSLAASWHRRMVSRSTLSTASSTLRSSRSSIVRRPRRRCRPLPLPSEVSLRSLPRPRVLRPLGVCGGGMLKAGQCSARHWYCSMRWTSMRGALALLGLRLGSASVSSSTARITVG